MRNEALKVRTPICYCRLWGRWVMILYPTGGQTMRKFLIALGAVLVIVTGSAGAEKKQPAPYIKPDPTTALREFDYNLFKVSRWARDLGAEQTAVAPHFKALGSSVDLYRLFFRENLTTTAGKPTQKTEPIILLTVEAEEKSPTKKKGVNRVLIDLEPAEIEVALAIKKTTEIETNPQYASPVFYCSNDWNKCTRQETDLWCFPLYIACIVQNVIPEAATFELQDTGKKDKKGRP